MSRAAWAIASVIAPSAFAAEYTRDQYSRAFATRGVPRLRRASSRQAPAVIGVCSLAAFTRTISASSSMV